MNPRSLSARIIAQLLKEKSGSLTQLLRKIPAKQSQISLVKALCFGVCRWYFRLRSQLTPLLARPLRSKDLDIEALLLIGLYELIYLNTPKPIVVQQTADAARELKKAWATPLVNAVLRHFLRNHPTLEFTSTFETLEAEYAHPKWLITMIQHAWKNDWKSILQANNQHPPLCLRVNSQLVSLKDYMNLLKNHGLICHPIPFMSHALVVDNPKEVTQLPGYSEGFFSVQDAAAQWVVELLDVAPGQRVLDACAAPGGKTLHLLEKQKALKALTAVDVSDSRLQRAKDNQVRLKLPDKIQWIAHDVAHLDGWWDHKFFDRILIDAPCSGSGVIRRHPDIKLLRHETDIIHLVNQQIHLLEVLWTTLTKGGKLLYTTCSILPQENEQVMLKFLSTHADAEVVSLPPVSPVSTQVGVQLLPGFAEMDGFYYACLKKIID